MQLKSPFNPGSENLDTISSFRVPSSSSRKNDGIFVLAVGEIILSVVVTYFRMALNLLADVTNDNNQNRICLNIVFSCSNRRVALI